MNAEFDYDINEFMDAEDTKGLYARFYVEPVKDEAASIEAGRPIFKEVEFVEIGAIGNRTSTVVYEVDDYQRQRFARQYQVFKRGGTEAISGTPLSEVPWMSRGQIEEFKFLKIRSIEDLANVSDSVCTSVAGLFALKARAQAWLAEAEGGKGMAVLAAKVEELTRQIAGMQAAQKSLEATNEASRGKKV